MRGWSIIILAAACSVLPAAGLKGQPRGSWVVPEIGPAEPGPTLAVGAGGEFAVVGYLASDRVVALRIFEPSGLVRSQRHYQFDEVYRPRSVSATSDGGWLMVAAGSGGGRTNLLLKVDPEGLPEWSRTFRSGEGSWLSAATGRPGGGLLVAGRTTLAEPGASCGSTAAPWLLELSEIGAVLRSRALVLDAEGSAELVTALPDGSAWLAGIGSLCPETDVQHAWLSRLDAALEPQWTASVGSWATRHGRDDYYWWLYPGGLSARSGAGAAFTVFAGIADPSAFFYRCESYLLVAGESGPSWQSLESASDCSIPTELDRHHRRAALGAGNLILAARGDGLVAHERDTGEIAWRSAGPATDVVAGPGATLVVSPETSGPPGPPRGLWIRSVHEGSGLSDGACGSSWIDRIPATITTGAGSVVTAVEEVPWEAIDIPVSVVASCLGEDCELACYAEGDCGNGFDDDGDGAFDCEDEDCSHLPECGPPGCEVDPDEDDDGFADFCDNCPLDWNPDQADPDADGVGSPCDNCNGRWNPEQLDGDADGAGDACDPDCEPEPELRLSRVPAPLGRPAVTRLRWPAAGAGAWDVHEGTLPQVGTLASRAEPHDHGFVACAWPETQLDRPAAAGGFYYLVARSAAGWACSLGRDSLGRERPLGTPPCP